MEQQSSWRPDFHMLTLNRNTARALEMVADLLIPGGNGYPPASSAKVVQFIEGHLSPGEQKLLEDLLSNLDHQNTEEAKHWLTQLEEEDPGMFGFIRWYVYCAYYASPHVLGALKDRGYDYHGAPQPHGYALEEDPPIPRGDRGSYIPTKEVKNVFSD